jgi:hypothetical protein
VGEGDKVGYVGRSLGARFCGPYVCLVCISTIIVEGVCVTDCRGLGMCIVATVVSGEGRSSVVTSWGSIGGGGKDSERVDEQGQKE